MKVQISISLGELIDKISILKIKQKHIGEPTKLELVNLELGTLNEELKKLRITGYEDYLSDLININQELWDIEDDIRVLEKNQRFDDEFVQLARKVYITNDKRFTVKNTINHHFGSEIKEVKSYEEYL